MGRSRHEDMEAELSRVRHRLDCLTDLRLEGEPSWAEKQEWARLAQREVELLAELKERDHS